MGIKTKIEWCDSTVNPTENCDGCELWNTKLNIRKCYAGRMVDRFRGEGAFDQPVRLMSGRMASTINWSDLSGVDRSDKPQLNGMPRVIFVGDMADIFSKGVPFEYLAMDVLETAASSRHLYLMLTKQAARMQEFVAWYLRNEEHTWPHNVWPGVSVTSQGTTPRLRALWEIRHLIKPVAIEMPKFFVSYGPALEPVNFSGYENAIDWMIIEGESGPDAAMLQLRTVRDTLLWCRLHHVTPFVKQMGTRWARAHGLSSYKGGDMNDWPAGIRVREMPR